MVEFRIVFRAVKLSISYLSIFAAASALAEPVTTAVSYKSTVSTDKNGPLDLTAELNFDSAKSNRPIMVVMHAYSTAPDMLTVLRPNAQRRRDAGFFVVSVAMRERDRSDGKRDSGGVEIHDIYDAVEHVKKVYPDNVDKTNVSITGYSGGGGNVMSALTKFPDYFRAGSGFFGMSDYGYDKTNGWFFNGADSGSKPQLIRDIGDPSMKDPATTDRYMARTSNLASKNNPYSEIHLFVNHDETMVSPINLTSYRDNAIAAASYPGEFNKIAVHIGGKGQYRDVNNNGVNEPNELQEWPHQYPTAYQQQSAESRYLPRLLNESIPEPRLNATDRLFVAGYVKTKRFSLWLGDGQNAAGDLDYEFGASSWRFRLAITTSVKSVEGELSVDTTVWRGQKVAVDRNGQRLEVFNGGATYKYWHFKDEDTLLMSLTR